MPFLHLRIAGKPLSTKDVSHLQTELTDLMQRILNKKKSLTAVLIEEVPGSGWSVGAGPVPLAAHLEAAITAGTNTSAEKAEFIAAAAQVLKRLCGDALPVATYVILREIDAESWGYDGQTQAARRPASIA